MNLLTLSSLNSIVWVSVIIFALVWAIFFAGISYYVARIKRRDPLCWAILGFFFGIVPLIVVLFLPEASGDDVPYSDEYYR